MFFMQRLWEETAKLKDDLEDMEKKLVEGKMEIEQTVDDYSKLKVCWTVFLYFLRLQLPAILYFVANASFSLWNLNISALLVFILQLILCLCCHAYDHAICACDRCFQFSCVCETPLAGYAAREQSCCLLSSEDFSNDC